MKNTSFSSIIQVFSQLFSDKKNISECLGKYCFRRQGENLNQKHCPIQAEVQQVIVPNPDLYSSSSKTVTANLLTDFTTEAQDICPTDETIKKSIKICKRRLFWYLYKDEQGRERIFTGNTKGTPRYNKKMASKIQDQINYFSEKQWETFALTITYDIKKHGENRFFAWKNYTSHINNSLEYFRKHYGLQYCWVKESTAKGYPHAHIVLCFPKGTVKSYDKMQNNKTMRYGWLYNEIKRRVDSPVFELRPIKGNNVKYYLTKYINKFSKANIFECGNENHEITPEEKKALLCLLFTIVTKTRQFGMTKFKKDEEQEPTPSAEELAIKSINKVVSKYPTNTAPHEVEGRDLARLRADLIKLCINPPCNMIHSLYSVRQSVLDDKNISPPTDKEQKTPEKFNEMLTVAKPIGCSGCFWSEFYKVVSGQPSKIFVILGSRLLFTDYEALVSALMPKSDNKAFFGALEFIYNYFMDIFTTEHTTFAQLLNDPYTEDDFKKKEMLDEYIELQNEIEYCKPLCHFDRPYKSLSVSNMADRSILIKRKYLKLLYYKTHKIRKLCIKRPMPSMQK